MTGDAITAALSEFDGWSPAEVRRHRHDRFSKLAAHFRSCHPFHVTLPGIYRYARAGPIMSVDRAPPDRQNRTLCAQSACESDRTEL